MKTKFKLVLTSILLSFSLLLGCRTVQYPQPDGTVITQQEVDVARIAHIAGAAAAIGGTIDLIKNPSHRPAYEVAVQALKSLEDSQNYDAGALAMALQGLKIRELQGTDGALYIQAVLIVWDQALEYAPVITRKELVSAVIPAIRRGLELALVQSIKPLPSADIPLIGNGNLVWTP